MTKKFSPKCNNNDVSILVQEKNSFLTNFCIIASYFLHPICAFSRCIVFFFRTVSNGFFSNEFIWKAVPAKKSQRFHGWKKLEMNIWVFKFIHRHIFMYFTQDKKMNSFAQADRSLIFHPRARPDYIHYNEEDPVLQGATEATTVVVAGPPAECPQPDALFVEPPPPVSCAPSNCNSLDLWLRWWWATPWGSPWITLRIVLMTSIKSFCVGCRLYFVIDVGYRIPLNMEFHGNHQN